MTRLHYECVPHEGSGGSHKLLTPASQLPYTALIAAAMRSKPATPANPTAPVRSAYSIRSWPSSSTTSRFSDESANVFSIVVSSRSAPGRSPRPVPTRLLQLVRHVLHFSLEGRIPAVEGFAGQRRASRRRHAQERREQRVLDQVLALILTNETNHQTLHLFLRH